MKVTVTRNFEHETAPAPPKPAMSVWEAFFLGVLIAWIIVGLIGMAVTWP